MLQIDRCLELEPHSKPVKSRIFDQRTLTAQPIPNTVGPLAINGIKGHMNQ